jgi:uncharacterized OB-fold protein
MTMSTGLLLPELTEETAPFWEGAARHELLVQKCDSCGRLRFPPRPVCPWCRSFDATWTAMSGKGTLWSWVIAHPPLLAAYAERAPYNVIVVQLDEDPTIRMVGNLDGDPEEVGIGGAVEVGYPDPIEDIVLPNWRPA